MFPPFEPEPYVDFNQEGPRAHMVAALEKVRGELGRSYPLWIDGEAVTPGQTFDSVSPGDPSRVVGTMAKANADLADKAVRSAADNFDTWKRYDP
ncbi:MAG: L-glutamate gamma-semialdehyde dehydrogenase, partial [Planctomycetes bacterium]|nr:L-glutamate gamma-semialdehyde dehydrogenase [Planctomycetota bacterium]